MGLTIKRYYEIAMCCYTVGRAKYILFYKECIRYMTSHPTVQYVLCHHSLLFIVVLCLCLIAQACSKNVPGVN